MRLKGIHEELIEAIKYNLSVVLENSVVQKIGLDLEEVAAWFQALGACNLLIYGDTDKFYENLIRSGHTRCYFLKRSRQEKNLNEYQQAISRWESFLDCVAAGDFSLSREIVHLSSNEWIKDGEYEDDFYYIYFLHNFVLDEQPFEKLNKILHRWEKWLESKLSTKYSICKSFLECDEVAFNKYFGIFLEEHTIRIERDKKTILAADITFEPRSRIFVEGLALLRIAKILKFTLEDEYPYCPRLALTSSQPLVVENIFDEIETLRGTT